MGKKKGKDGRLALYRELVPGTARPQNPNQIRTRGLYQCSPTALSTSLSGIIADSSMQCRLSAIPNYTYLQSLWEEYRILRAMWKIYPCDPSATGVTKFYCDESDTTTPTLGTAGQKLGIIVPNTSSAGARVHTVKWAAQDLKDLQWTTTTSTTTFVTLKAYTDGNYGCTTTSTQLWVVQMTVELELRGQGGN